LSVGAQPSEAVKRMLDKMGIMAQVPAVRKGAKPLDEILAGLEPVKAAKATPKKERVYAAVVDVEEEAEAFDDEDADAEFEEEEEAEASDDEDADAEFEEEEEAEASDDEDADAEFEEEEEADDPEGDEAEDVAED
jgi:hypothetical protein